MVRVLVAYHNRRDLTVGCLARLKESAELAGIRIAIYAFDDGSTDGTSDALRESGVDCTFTFGDGAAFWARGMSIAEASALRDAADSDVLLWLNDDVSLDRTAMARIQEQVLAQPGAVLVFATREPGSERISYSGFRRSGWHPLSFARVEPAENDSTSIDTFNGNLVAVPVAVAKSIGGIDGGFSHALADIDYGLRAGQAGVPVLLAPGTFGDCPANGPRVRSSVIDDWRQHVGVKGGGNFASVKRFVTRHEPRKWPVALIASYAKWWANRLRPEPRAHSAQAKPAHPRAH